MAKKARAPKKDAEVKKAKVEVPSTDEEDVKDMREAKEPVRQKSKKEVLNEEE